VLTERCLESCNKR